MSRDRAVAFAPASVGNCAVGFDLIGHALEGPGDRVVATRTSEHGVRVDAIRGLPIELPREVEKNTAARAVASLLRSVDAQFGITLEIEKGIALGSGMGGSAASAVAALVAANALLDTPLPLDALYPHALTLKTPWLLRRPVMSTCGISSSLLTRKTRLTLWLTVWRVRFLILVCRYRLRSLHRMNGLGAD